jgi:hypothetical protein
MAAKGEPFTPRPEGVPGRRAPKGHISHGSAFGYNQAGCRCKKCKAWQRAYSQARRTPELAAAQLESQKRWRRANPAKQAARVADNVARVKRQNEELRECAARHGQQWTGTDLEMAARKDLTVAEIAAVLGRSLRSVSTMRQCLADGNPRDRMLAHGPVPPTSRSGPR